MSAYTPMALNDARSSVGSDIFAVTAILVVSVSVLMLLRYYLPLRTTPAYLLVPIFLALALPISIILLVPIDLASSSGTDAEETRGIWLPEGVMLVAWRIAYWLTFGLTWIILPLLGNYADAGYRTPKDRFLYSLRENGRYQLIVLSCAMIGLIYFILQSGFNPTSIKGLVMALAYCWGLFLAIYLMGHGLVAIPRRLFRNASISGRLRRIQYQAPKVYDRLMDSLQGLEELENQVQQLRKRKTGTARQFQEWIGDLEDALSLPESRAASTRTMSTSGSAAPTVITERYLAELTRKLNQARHKRVRFTDAWNLLIQDAADTQAVLDSFSLKHLEFGKLSPHASFLERLNIMTPYTRFLLHTYVLPASRYFHGSIFAFASVSIVWSELIKFVNPKLSIIALTVVHHRKSDRGQIGFAGQVIASLWILYMCAAALMSISDAKVWGNRALVRRNTYGESACWYASQIAKLTVPLTYNFITFLPEDIFRSTTFYRFLGRLIDLTPLGKGFVDFFPIFILVPVCATLFNLYGKVKQIFGFGILEDDDEENPSGYGTGGWREGRDLIERELSGNAAIGLSTQNPSSSTRSTNEPVGLDERRDFQASPSTLSSSQNAGYRIVPTVRATQRQGHRSAVASDELDEEEDENFFQGFVHRVKNTLDTTSKPQWVADLSDNFKRPKWMGGVDGNTEQSGRADHGAGLGRWFGGRPSDGRVRL
ncbi:MAG: hypothetical protein M1827_004865 [Pycnora praestabilis]|nr:MAG: hypothetical protein M1827_004865 [Pycnora praestabilis]